jgi:hypothetical protein
MTVAKEVGFTGVFLHHAARRLTPIFMSPVPGALALILSASLYVRVDISARRPSGRPKPRSASLRVCLLCGIHGLLRQCHHGNSPKWRSSRLRTNRHLLVFLALTRRRRTETAIPRNDAFASLCAVFQGSTRITVGQCEAPKETWWQGVTVFFNPNARVPLADDFFPHTSSFRLVDGLFVREVLDFHPLVSWMIASRKSNSP